MTEQKNNNYIRWFEDLGSGDVSSVGGKNASLGEMLRELKSENIRVPDGFATTAGAYREYLSKNKIKDQIKSELEKLKDDQSNLETIGRNIRKLFLKNEIPEAIADEIRQAYQELSKKYDQKETDVAVRSSATAEDLPEASFAGQQETFLNISGDDDLLEACKKCYASLFTDRAISYREEKKFDHLKVALSVGVQKMVRSDKSGSGVMFSIDTETGFPGVVVINAAWGLGENIVQGTVNPDEYLVFKSLLEEKDYIPIIGKNLGDKEKKMVYATGGSKTTKNVNTSKKERRSFVLNDDEILKLSRWASVIEKHYDK
jgi:pyruvate,water dikinase